MSVDLNRVKRIKITEAVEASQSYNSKWDLGCRLWIKMGKTASPEHIRNQMSKWDLGHTVPNVDTLYCMAQVLGCTMEDLIESK